MEKYIKVDILKYVREGLENGSLEPIIAEKFTRITARQGQLNEEVISWSVDDKGNEIKEKIAKVTLDKNTNEPAWIATKTDENGKIVIDNNGHTNQWIIDDSTFKRKYQIDPMNPTLFKPNGGPQIFVQIPDNITLNQWGSDMQISAGGFINITNPNDMYGISQRDFEDTYKYIDKLNKKNAKPL